MEYSTKKHFMVLETGFFCMEIGMLKIEVAALLLRGVWDSHCLQMLSFKHLEIQLLNVRLYHYSWLISLHLSLCLRSVICGGIFWPSWSCFASGGPLGFCSAKKHTIWKKRMGSVPVVALLLKFTQFPIIRPWVNGNSELVAMLVGSLLFHYRKAVKSWKLLILLLQLPRQRTSATCQASDTRWVL